MNINPNSPTRSKPDFSSENPGNDTIRVVVLPHALFSVFVVL